MSARHIHNHIHNHRLHVLIKEAGWNGQALAEAINVVGREASLPLHYSRSSVAQWLAGMQPRQPVPYILAETLSRRLGRPVTPGDAGFEESRSEAGELAGGPADRLVALAAAADPRNLGTSAYRVFSLTHLSVPDGDALARPPVSPTAREGPLRVGPSDIEAATAMLRLFADAEATSGAGLMRPALTLYLANTIAPFLRASSPEIGPELLPVAAWLTYLCGLMYYDDELHGFAQRYYRVAIRLADEARATGPASLALRAMSAQVLSLGYRGHALNLAQHAVDLAGGARPSPDRASLFGQLAVARAATGDRRGALADIDAARSFLEQGPDGENAVGVYHEATLAYERGVLLALLGDRHNAIAELEYSIRRHPPLERRSRAITLTRLADLQLRLGRLDQAIATWHRFLDDYPAISSGRVRTALANLRASIRPHQSLPAADALLARATSLQRLPQVAPGPSARPAAVPPQDAETRTARLEQWDRPFTRFCVGCGAPIQPDHAGRPHRHCGPTCRQHAHRMRRS